MKSRTQNDPKASGTGDARRNQRGVALLLVLWIFMILGVLALDFAKYMRDDAMAAVNFADETRGYYVALAGMNRAILDAERQMEDSPAATARQDTNRQDTNAPDIDEDEEFEQLVPPDGQWHDGDFAGGKWSVRMTDEGGRISINRTSDNPVLLKRVVSNLMMGGDPTAGVDRRTSNAIDTVVDSILDWRDPGDEKRAHGAENEYYMKRRPPYTAKNGFFDSPEELLLVRGVTSELFYGHDGVPGLRDVITTYGKTRKLNIRSASPAVLQVVLGTDPETAADLIEQRDSGAPIVDQIRGMLNAIDPALAETVGDFPPRVVTVEARGDLMDKRNQSRVAAVADLSAESSQGIRILRWLDRAPWAGPLPSTGERPEGSEDTDS
jgi:general secretion pathway protein K